MNRLQEWEEDAEKAYEILQKRAANDPTLRDALDKMDAEGDALLRQEKEREKAKAEEKAKGKKKG